MTFKDRYGDHSNEVHEGDLICIANKLKSLEGAPKIVNGGFYCKNNSELTSLDGLLETELKGKIISDLDSKDFKNNQLLYKKLGKKRYKAYMYLSK